MADCHKIHYMAVVMVAQANSYKSPVIVCLLSVILQCFGAVGWVTGRASACKGSATTIPDSLLLGTGLTWGNLTWCNCGKMGAG